MSAVQLFSEVSVLIPGHSIEDLPTDLPEDDAASLLNALACAWHPRLLLLSGNIPVFRQVESLTDYPGRRIVFVPTSSESWMPHEWRTIFREQGHIILSGCSRREEWITAIDAALAENAADNQSAGAEQSQVPDDLGTQQFAASEAAPMRPPVLLDHFLALGVILMQVQLLSRRRHHFVDADKLLLSREVGFAASASVRGDESTVRRHLARCFEHLRDTREKFYPMDCYLLDFCIPGDDSPVSEIAGLIQSAAPTARLNLLATGRDLAAWSAQDTGLATQLRYAVNEGLLTVLTGHDTEIRSSLNSMTATISDIDHCRRTYIEIFDTPPRHWARRRFGLMASLPTLLSYFGFESALHIALDDGLYPDKERSQFDWQAPDGSQIPAASRIPLAIDSAAGFLRLADRYNESMQDDNTAALFLARLPILKSPWLRDLQIAAAYAPVLGEFATMDSLVHACSGSRMTERYRHSEYLSPYLIQATVLQTEAPISGPALLRQLQQQLLSLRVLFAMTRLVRAEGDADIFNSGLDQIDADLAALELQQLNFATTLSVKAPALQAAAALIETQLASGVAELTRLLRSQIPQQPDNTRGLLMVNSVPFSRFVDVEWPSSWKRPNTSRAIELIERADNKERLLVKLPPGGFVWLNESNSASADHPILEPIPREPPLAESLTLRNRHFEVTLSERTGSIAAVTYHHQRGNRLSQQVCFRYEREQTLPDDGSGEIRKSAYSTACLINHRMLHVGTVFASIETTAELRSPIDGSRLATLRQITAVDRVQPRIQVTLIFDEIATAVKGNPWLTYYGCRFAWENEAAPLSRGVMGQAAGFRSDRFESPDFVEVSDSDHRVVIATHGRPYHRRSGPRMFDSLLIVEGEPAREFRFTIDFDQRFAMRTAIDAMTPPLITQTSGAAPVMMSSWVLGLSARNVELVYSKVRPATDDSSEEISMLLTEIDGTATKCLVRTARRPTAAFVVNADRSEKAAAEITDEGVVVQLMAFQLKEVLLIL